MDIIKKELNKVKEYILEGFLDPFPSNELKDFLAGKSKMIRSILAVLWLKANNANLTDNIYKILAVGEIIHNASLLHDDVVDNAETRRGTKTLSRLFAPKISVLAGDYLVSLGIGKLSTIDNKNITSIFQNCVKNMSLAEIKQYFLRDKLPTKEEYIEICRGKTARLFSAILESSAILTELNSNEAKYFGELFGIYFQIKNDLSEESAKNDRQNGVFTAKDIIGIENTVFLSDNYKEQMREIINKLPENKYREALEDLIR